MSAGVVPSARLARRRLRLGATAPGRHEEEEGVTLEASSASNSHAHDDTRGSTFTTTGVEGVSGGGNTPQQSRGVQEGKEQAKEGNVDGKRRRFSLGAAAAVRASRGAVMSKVRNSKKRRGFSAKTNNPSIGKSNLDAILAENRPKVIEDSARSDLKDEDDVEMDKSSVPMTMTARWKRRITFAARTMQIWAFLFHVLIKLFRQKLVQSDEARMSARRRKLGKYLCKAFLKLGPTFIKIGQVCLRLCWVCPQVRMYSIINMSVLLLALT